MWLTFTETRCHHFMDGGSGSVVGTRACSPVSMCEPKGVLRICGDSGDGYGAHDGNMRAYSRQALHVHVGGPLAHVGDLQPLYPLRPKGGIARLFLALLVRW